MICRTIQLARLSTGILPEEQVHWPPLPRTPRYPLSSTDIPVRPMRRTPSTGHPARAAHGHPLPQVPPPFPAPGPPPAGGASPRPGRAPCPGNEAARVCGRGAAVSTLSLSSHPMARGTEGPGWGGSMPGSMLRSMLRYLILFSTRSPLTKDHWTVSPLRMPMASARALGMAMSSGPCTALVAMVIERKAARLVTSRRQRPLTLFESN